MHFSETGLSEKVLRAVTTAGYEETTPIQEKAIPPILAGKDLMGVAQTGTGKTAAFALPTLDLLASSPKPPRAKKKKQQGRRGRPSATPDRDVRSLILAPTRELAAQILASLAKYGKSTGLRQAAIFGGVSQSPQVRRLQQGVDILVATPGRLLDLMNQGYIDLNQIEVLILDEADQMLDMGFLPDLKKIIAAVPKVRQTLMFSATMPKEILKLAEQWLTKPVDVRVAPASTPIESVTQSVWKVKQQSKPQLLVHYLCEYPWERTIVFTRTKHGADKVVKRLIKSGIKADAIHGNKSQNARTRSIESFKSTNPPVLVATDIAARGLDISGVSHVINYDLPDVPETYVHRIGRTGRAGKTGIATSFCAPGERNQLKQIERLIRKDIPIEDDHPEYEKGVDADTPGAAPRRPTRSSSQGGRGESKGYGSDKRSSGSQGRSSSAKGSRSGGDKKYGDKKYAGKKTDAKKSDSKKYEGKKSDGKKPEGSRAGSSTRSRTDSKTAAKKYGTKRAPSDRAASDSKPSDKKTVDKKPAAKKTTTDKKPGGKSTAKKGPKSSSSSSVKGGKKGAYKGAKSKTSKGKPAGKSVASKTGSAEEAATVKKKSRPGKRERQAIKDAKKNDE